MKLSQRSSSTTTNNQNRFLTTYLHQRNNPKRGVATDLIDIPSIHPSIHPTVAMVLPPVEVTPVAILKWTEKAVRSEGIIPLVEEELQKNGSHLIVLQNTIQDVTLLTATQSSLELQAEKSQLIKQRTLPYFGEVVMDYFTIKSRRQFLTTMDETTKKTSGSRRQQRQPRHLDPEGLFTVHERCILVEDMLENIRIQNEDLATMLCEDASNDKNKKYDMKDRTQRHHLRYLLESHGWVEVMTPLHIDSVKDDVLMETMWNFRTIPLQKIHDYYGPTIAYYFAFLGFLGRWLFVLAIPGTTVFAFRWYRNDTIDNDEYTPFYGLLCFFLALLFCRLWKRQEMGLAYEWGESIESFDNNATTSTPGSVSSSSSLSKSKRPEFTGTMRKSPVTGKQELYYPTYRRKIQYVINGMITACMLSVAFLVMILSLNLQGYIKPRNNQFHHPFYFEKLADLAEDGAIFDAKSSWKCFLPVIIHVVGILTLNTIYRTVARYLTDWENHETYEAYENSVILKRFLFEFFDCYIVLFYLAFYERDIERLRAELIAVFNIDTFRRLATELIIPTLISRFTKRRNKEHPQDLHLDTYESFDDYMEMLISFGYVTLFASAYPLASLIMCGAVFVEIRSDIYKISKVCQKPLDERVSSIGMWLQLLQGMVWLSCLTNCLLFGFTSDQMMHYLPDFYTYDEEVGDNRFEAGWKGRVGVFLIFAMEHLLIISGLILNALIPEMPAELSTKLKRRSYLLSNTGYGGGGSSEDDQPYSTTTATSAATTKKTN